MNPWDGLDWIAHGVTAIRMFAEESPSEREKLMASVPAWLLAPFLVLRLILGSILPWLKTQFGTQLPPVARIKRGAPCYLFPSKLLVGPSSGIPCTLCLLWQVQPAMSYLSPETLELAMLRFTVPKIKSCRVFGARVWASVCFFIMCLHCLGVCLRLQAI